jgi:VanZ family protein
MNRFLRALCVASWVGVALWAATIFVLSSMSGKAIEQLNVWHMWDKEAHFIAFAAGGLLLALALQMAFRWRRAVVFRRTLLVLAFFAASDEWHQLYTPGRSGADVRDWLADVLGVSLGAALVCVVRPGERRISSGPAADATEA